MSPSRVLSVILALVLPSVNCQQLTTLGCSLEVVVDPSLRNAVFGQLSNANSESFVANPLGYLSTQITDLVSDHIYFANKIIGRYDFGIPNFQYKLHLKRLKILDEEHCSYKGVDYCQDTLTNATVQSYLDHHSQGDHSDVCLSYVFTNRNFERGSLGLAYTATINDDRGGICDHPDPTKSGGSQGGLNTGLLTFTHNNVQVPEIISKFAFAHEIGHSFGSHHDLPQDCIYDRDGGTYLMHAQGAKGFHPSNYQLSTCSLNNITLVVKALLEDDKNCLVKVPISSCGNGVLEGWEECDCGMNEEECHDKCCQPASSGEAGCTLTSGSQCSPTEGPCCSWECSLIDTGNSSRAICLAETDCHFASFCDGIQAFCPQMSPKSDEATCATGTKMCQNGHCALSICTKFNMLECHPQDEDSCEIHCQVQGKPETCKASSELGPLFEAPAMRPVSTVCSLNSNRTNNFGYCNSLGICDQFIQGESLPSSGWYVGLGIFLICYILMMVLALWVYCRYCKGSRKRPHNSNKNLKTVKTTSE
eukprot:maker-scaffold412_size179788-snap-gene-0.23 protein:Tk11835 transcript:maker-scaffold412_size179788-snap-gene-0.23-mRNA-1 annotation:"adam 10"